MELLVFDVGGSHVTGALCNAEALRLSARESVPLDAHGTEDDFYTAIHSLSSQILRNQEMEVGNIDGMSFAFPGPFDYEEGISLVKHKFAALYGKSLRTALASRFGLQPAQIQFVNDADAFLLGELSQLPHAREGKTIGITLGTGVGSAFAIDGKIVHRGPGVPLQGEIWNLPWSGGILEDAISTRAIQSAYEKRTRQQRSVREIAERSHSDTDAATVLKNFGTTLGDALRAVAAPFQPKTIIFGGAISRSAELFLPHTAERFGEGSRLLVSSLFEDAALYGAAVRWKQVNTRAMKS